jgi:cytochrome c biogenesis protein
MGSPLARQGRAVWGTLTSVPFAVLLIILLAISGLIGTVIRQFPGAALHDPAMYAQQVAEMHRRWDAIAILGLPIGPAMVEVFETLGFFRVFSAPWFLLLITILVIAIICCTLDRTPRLWRGVRAVTVEQPASFFDARLSDRAVMEHATLGSEDLAHVFRRRRFKVRQAVSEDGAVRWVYGDRNQYFKMATLLTHLGLILFLGGGALTVAVGFETILFVGEGQTAPVRAVGTRDNLLVKNNDFEAPRNAQGGFADFWTDLVVYQNGEEVARKVIHVNDPLTVDGYRFHQNTFGPGADIEIRDARDQLVWTGSVVMNGFFADTFPQGFMTIPGSDVGLVMLLNRFDDSAGMLVLQGVGPPDETGQATTVFPPVAVGIGGTTDPDATAGYSITWLRASAWTGLVIKKDPGELVIWAAFACLIAGLSLTFYFPRRRIWARIEGDRIGFAMLGDRYVDVPRELRGLMEDVAVRGGGRAAART